ncbi:hypothetical protein TNIN_429601 [Trichonephila inaurata madagascariensis]|uniref:Uncharacterized protein n=1 Tax=Trichonephila inaurata madagascariensis TaxID=2747483 RepID=A0A8X6WZW8_9ARAC|nr:hypothetical protein TNIN_429601 [Trichonephila inaurata madagascariensis]
MDASRYGCQKVFSQRASDIPRATLPQPNDSPWGAPDDITQRERTEQSQIFVIFSTFDDLSDSPLNILETFKKSIRIEFETPPVKQSEVLMYLKTMRMILHLSDSLLSTGFTQEEDDNHRAYRMELYFKPSLDAIPEEEEFEEPSKEKCSRRWKIKFRNMFKKLHLLCCFKKR